MRLYRGIDSFEPQGDCVVTVGSFDGVHSGHASLLDTLCGRARQRGAQSVVVSFSPHPRVTLGRAEGLKLLNSDMERALLLDSAGVDALLLLEFDTQFSALSYEEFVVEYLLKRVKMVELVVGFNHHMGHNGGGYENLTTLSARYNFETTLAKEYSCGEEQISSTTIRELLEAGEIEAANRLLSHNYPIFGWADNGGRVQSSEPLKLIPPEGEYLAEVDGAEQVIRVDGELTVWCQQSDKNVKIKLIKRL